MLVVEQERKRLGLSQSKLARLADVNATSMSRIERGKEPAYPHRGKRIADALGWTGEVSALFEEVEPGDTPEKGGRYTMAELEAIRDCYEDAFGELPEAARLMLEGGTDE